ncbi:hypothetical protein SODALDRAFT_328190 [Sodiomyces alkalinus F11]|uniref:Uncharacterized protein n=1 Tax=Sodiomyces alkalinus (strain CBS 110278 / VKM F-3762 / F11) TaxID=1314773 RepID=A0A3N2PMP4_SODAK|nr:hypothetical protein SODALDRAFT_328190 [Sodiomyces alkalinus F11]ROT35801.1 hypothetical protein SODALDRAFT_328190 [Sodiomyces alkalinus F11]
MEMRKMKCGGSSAEGGQPASQSLPRPPPPPPPGHSTMDGVKNGKRPSPAQARSMCRQL